MITKLEGFNAVVLFAFCMRCARFWMCAGQAGACSRHFTEKRANGWVLMARIIEVIGDEPLIADYYRALIETVMGQPMPPLSNVQ